MSRQSLLAQVAGAKNKQLDQAIDEVVLMNTLPRQLADELDAVREIGNFGVHPMKSAILDVAPGEAEWNLTELPGRDMPVQGVY